MSLVLEEVPELSSESPPESEKPDTHDKPPRARKPVEEAREKVDWKEKVPCPGCARLLSRHTLEFSHPCKGPKKEKASRVRFEPRDDPPQVVHLPEPPAMSHEQMIRLMIKQERERREAAICAPMRRFYGLQ